MIVIDVGCAKYGGDESIPYLIEEFDPDVVYGFDPSPAIGAVQPIEGDRPILYLIQKAAWTHDGRVGFHVEGLGGHVEEGAPSYQCVDLAQFILDLPEDEEIVLKMDAEGAEYVVLPHLVAADADLRLRCAIIEWHCEVCGIGGNGRHRDACEVDRDWWVERRESVESTMRCEMLEWNR